MLANMDNLFKLIISRGITAKALSDATGISTGNISDWKSGRSSPTVPKLIQLATFFNVSTDYLLGLSDDPRPADSLRSTSEEKRRFLSAFDAADDSIKSSVRKLLDL